MPLRSNAEGKASQPGLSGIRITRALPRFETLKQVLSGTLDNIPGELQTETARKKKRNREHDLDLSPFLANLSLSETIMGEDSASYDSCTITLKFDIDSFKWYFGDGLGQIQTGHYFKITRPTASYANFSEDIIKESKDARIREIWSDKADISRSPTAYYNHENILLYRTAIDSAVAAAGDVFDSAVAPKTKKSKRPEANINEEDAIGIPVTTNSQRKLDEATSKNVTNKKIDTFDIASSISQTCIFFGVLTNINQLYEIDPDTGLGVFNVTLRCKSFIYSLGKSDYLPQMPERQIGLLKDAEPNALNQFRYKITPSGYNYFTKYGIPKTLNRILKTPDYYINLASQYSTGTQLASQDDKTLINVKQQMTKIIRAFGNNYIPAEFHSGDVELYGESAEIIDEIDGSVLSPNGFLTIGAIINVVTEQSHLPESCSYRQFLPVKSVIGNIIQGFKTFGNNRTQAWNLLNGTFVPDSNLYEFFPLLVPITNYSEIELAQAVDTATQNLVKNNKPIPPFQLYKISEVIRQFYIDLGAIPCVVYRLKPLDPDFPINIKAYKKLLSDTVDANAMLFQMGEATMSESNRFGTQIQEHIAKNITFSSETLFFDTADNDKIVDEFGTTTSMMNQDACVVEALPVINMDDVVSIDWNNDENERINAVIVNPIQQESDVSTTVLMDTYGGKVFQWYAILMDGIRLYHLETPFVETAISEKRISKKYCEALAERIYSIYGEGNKKSFGQIVIKGEIDERILKGSWIRLDFSSPIIEKAIANNLPFNQIEKFRLIAKYTDFYCYIHSIERRYSIVQGNIICSTTLHYNRGKFGLLPPLFPDLFDNVIGTDKVTTQEEMGNTVEQRDFIDQMMEDIINNTNNTTSNVKAEDKVGFDAVAAAEVFGEYFTNMLGHLSSLKSFFPIIEPTNASALKTKKTETIAKAESEVQRIKKIRKKTKADIQKLEFYQNILNLNKIFTNPSDEVNYQQPATKATKLKKKR